jgi:hypothetical protein
MKYLRFILGIILIILSVFNLYEIWSMDSDNFKSFKQLRVQESVSIFALVIGIYFIFIAIKKKKTNSKSQLKQ